MILLSAVMVGSFAGFLRTKGWECQVVFPPLRWWWLVWVAFAAQAIAFSFSPHPTVDSRHRSLADFGFFPSARASVLCCEPEASWFSPCSAWDRFELVGHLRQWRFHADQP